MRVFFLLVVAVPLLFTSFTVQGRRNNKKRQVFFPDEESGDVGETGFTGGTGSENCRTPDGAAGVCTLLPHCTVLYDLLSVPSPASLNYLRQSICGYKVLDPEVCCPYSIQGIGIESGSPFLFGPTSVRPPKPLPKPVSPSTSGRPTLPARCGITNATSTRIVGGEDAPPGAWPWIALLGYRDATTGKIDYLCGGALVSQTHVVTAAHCVHNKNDLYSIRLGEHDINSELDGVRHQDILISSRTSHESFDSVSFRNDIAVLKLSKRAEFNAFVQPICLPIDPSIQNKNYVKSFPFIAGWGATSFNGPTSGTLREVQIPIVTQDSCKESYRDFRTVVVDDAVLCAGLARGGKDACQGDSGGPLMIPEKDKFYLLGVVSFGYKCAEPGYPGVYTRLTHYINWVMDKMH